MSIPWTLWFVRNYYHNLPIIPHHWGVEILRTTTDNYYTVDGYIKWTNTWIVNEYQLASAWNPLPNKEFKDIFIDFENIKLDEDIKKESKILFNELITYAGQPIPKKIDNEFRKLTQITIDRDKFNYYFVLPLKRMVFQWGNIASSNGWPVELQNITHKERINLLNANFKEKVEWVIDHPDVSLIKIIPNFWRLLILMIFFISIVINFKEKKLKNFTLVIFSYFFIKNIFAGYANFIEVRYLINLIPILEVICCLSIISFIERKKIER